jgi:hypothetical protein
MPRSASDSTSVCVCRLRSKIIFTNAGQAAPGTSVQYASRKAWIRAPRCGGVVKLAKQAGPQNAGRSHSLQRPGLGPGHAGHEPYRLDATVDCQRLGDLEAAGA